MEITYEGKSIPKTEAVLRKNNLEINKQYGTVYVKDKSYKEKYTNGVTAEYIYPIGHFTLFDADYLEFYFTEDFKKDVRNLIKNGLVTFKEVDWFPLLEEIAEAIAEDFNLNYIVASSDLKNRNFLLLKGYTRKKYHKYQRKA